MPEIIEDVTPYAEQKFQGQCMNCLTEFTAKGSEFSEEFPGDKRKPAIKCPSCGQFCFRTSFYRIDNVNPNQFSFR